MTVHNILYPLTFLLGWWSHCALLWWIARHERKIQPVQMRGRDLDCIGEQWNIARKGAIVVFGFTMPWQESDAKFRRRIRERLAQRNNHR